MITALLGFAGIFIFGYVIVFIASLFGRATNTTFVTRGGAHIQPYKTPSERRQEEQQEEQQEEMVWKINQLNYFCVEFAERKNNSGAGSTEFPQANAALYAIGSYNVFSDLSSPLGIPSASSKMIVSLGNTDIALKHYQDLKSLKETGMIDNDEYKRRGVMLLKKVTGEI